MKRYEVYQINPINDNKNFDGQIFEALVEDTQEDTVIPMVVSISSAGYVYIDDSQLTNLTTKELNDLINEISDEVTSASGSF